MRRLVVAGALLAGCGGAPKHTQEMEQLAQSGQYEQAVDKYAELLHGAPERGITRTQFEAILPQYCDAARRLGEQVVAESPATPAERQARVIDVRAKVGRCPALIELVTRLGDELEKAETAGWDADVAPLEARGDLAGAFLAAKKWVTGLEPERALWKRYAALSKKLAERYEAAAKAAGEARPNTAWMYESLARSVRGEGEVRQRPSARWDFTLVAAETAVGGTNVEPWCADFAGHLKPPVAPASGANPVKVRVALTGCSSAPSDADDTGFDTKMELGWVQVPREVCNQVQDTQLVTRMVESCNQYGLNCYSYMVGEWVPVTRTVCHTVMESVQQMVPVQVPYDAVRPGISMSVSYALTIERDGKHESDASHASFSARGNGLVRKPADPNQVAAGRPGVSATFESARKGLAPDVANRVRFRVLGAMARERAEAAAKAESAGDTALARELRLEIANGPDVASANEALAWLARGEGLARGDFENLLSGKEQVQRPGVFSLGTFYYDVKRIDVESKYAVLRYGVAPLAGRFAPMFVSFEAVPSQPERRGILTGASGGFSPALQLREDGFGLGYQDDAAYGLWFGGRVSDPYEYPGSTNPGEEEDHWLSYGYLFSYTGMVGWRGETLGLFGGARAEYSGLRLGDARTAGAAWPFVAQLEWRFSEEMPLIAQAWGGDVLELGETPRSLGASIDIPLALNVWLYGRYERKHLEMQFGGLTRDDPVTAGRRDSTYITVGASLSLQ